MCLIPRELRVCSAPQLAEVGGSGERLWAEVELKLVADVGIIGVPNAGKSTLLSVVTRAKPKIANYQFTTLVPNLGVCELDYRSMVFADIPGKLNLRLPIKACSHINGFCSVFVTYGWATRMLDILNV